MTNREWKMGDRVVHAGKPEWGVGEVRSAEGTTHGGVRCQRLTVRFDRAGVKVISTAFADLRSPESVPTLLRSAAEGASETDEVEAVPDTSALEERLTTLPESATDPFASRRSRLKATFGLYRFSGVGASLLDWAASQTQLKDPLSCFSRHDLERLFDRFRIALDMHTRKLVVEARRQDPAVLAEVLAQAPLSAQQAVRRVDAGR